MAFRAAEAFVEVTADLDTGPVLSATRRTAEAVESELTQAADDAGKAMTDSMSKAGKAAGDGFTRDANGRLRDSKGRFAASAGGVGASIGSTIAEVGSAAMGRGFKLFAKPHIAGPLITVAAAAAPFIGATLGAGIASSAGLALMSGGITLALKDPEIQAQAKKTGKAIGERLEGFAEPFKVELLDALDQAERSFAAWDPYLRRLGHSTSAMIEPLSTGLTGLVTRALPGLDRMMARMGPLWQSIGDELVMIGRDVGRVFDMLSDNGAEFAVAMNLALTLVRGSILAIGMVINGLTEAFGWVIDRVAELSQWAVQFGTALANVPGPLGAVGDGLRWVGEQSAAGIPKWEAWKNAARGAGDTTLGTAIASATLTERQRLLNMSMEAAIVKAGSLKAAFDLLTGVKLSARQAESNYQAAIDAVSASMKENGKTLDLSTAKGRANDTVIRGLVDSIGAKAQAAYDDKMATGDAAGAQAAATKVYQDGRAQLVKNLTAILGNAAAAEKMADEVYGIPKTWHTKTSADTSGAKGAIQTYKEWLRTIPRTVVTRMIVEQSSARGGHKEFARGGEVTGGSGVRDDVPILAMADEWVIRKSSVRALERQYGPGIMEALNSADGRGGRVPAQSGGTVRSSASGATPGGPGAVYQFGPGSIVLDMSGVRSVVDFLAMIDSLPQAARMMGATR